MKRATRVLQAGAALCAACLLAVPPAALADEPGGVDDYAPGEATDATDDAGSEGSSFDWTQVGAGALDILLLRPMGVCASVTGAALFLFAAPLSAPSGNVGTSFDFLVRQPGEYTFVRPLGEF